jgi:membrane-associated protease RseP (regulator of RpoE activity)
MSIYPLVALLVVFAYYVLVNAANRAGVLERHNMTLVIGLIVMWRTRRGRTFIERLSGRGSRAEVLRVSLEEARKDIAEARDRLERATSTISATEGVRRYWGLAIEARALKDERARRAEARGPEDRAQAEAGPEDPRLATLKAEMEVIEASVPPDSRLHELLRAADLEEAELSLAAIEADNRKRAGEAERDITRLEGLATKDSEELEGLESKGESRTMERQSRRRLVAWKAYGTGSILFIILVMGAMLTLLIWQAFVVVRVPPGVIKPQQMLGLPGINPVIPLWYGIAGLVVAMVFHELAHGVLARVGKVPVKSLGLLFLVVPIGAFVEPDEDVLAKADRMRRARVFAVGPMSNIIVAALSVMVFAWVFMAALEPAQEGVVLNYIVDEQELHIGNGTTATERTPASTAGLVPWSIITRMESLDGPPIGPDGQNLSDIREVGDFLDTMERTQAGQTVRVTWWHDGTWSNATVTLWDRGQVYPDEGYEGQGYIGASSRLISEVPAGEYPSALAHPRDYATGALGLRNITFLYISLPFTSPTLQPAPQGVTQAFRVTGPLAGLGTTGFWVLANLLYWVFWLNLMVGIFNALPAIPLDGGYIFRDALSGVWQRLRPTLGAEGAERLANRVTGGLSVLILGLILWQFLGPYMGAALGL